MAEVAGVLIASEEPELASDPLVGMSTEDLCLDQKAEMETKNKELEVQAMHLRIRALELEKGAPVASTSVSINQSTDFAPVKFDMSKHIALVPTF